MSEEEPRKQVYEELRKLAYWQMRKEASPHTLQPTALLHEAWLRLGGDKQQEWQSRAEFFAAAAESMRRILIDRARRKKTVRYGGHLRVLDVEDWEVISEILLEGRRENVKALALHEALDELAQEESDLAELVKLRYFAGMTNAELAETLNLSERTVQRWLAFARAWLKCQMESQ